jgi:hypothetical protein
MVWWSESSVEEISQSDADAAAAAAAACVEDGERAGVIKLGLNPSAGSISMVAPEQTHRSPASTMD